MEDFLYKQSVFGREFTWLQLSSRRVLICSIGDSDNVRYCTE